MVAKMAGLKRYPSYSECVAQVLSQAKEPMTFAALMEGVGELRPATKGTRLSVYRAIEELFQAVPLEPYGSGVRDNSRFGWLANLVAGSTIRHSLEREEVRGGYVRLDELEHALLVPDFFQELEPSPRLLTVQLFGGASVSAEVHANRDVWALDIGNAMVGWLDEQGAMSDDDLIIQVEDATAGKYAMRLQPREARDEDGIDERNRQLAEAAEGVAIGLGREQDAIYTWNLVARLLGNGVYRALPAPDDLHYVLAEYSRLEIVAGMGYEVDIAGARSSGVGVATPSARTRGRAVSAATRPGSRTGAGSSKNEPGFDYPTNREIDMAGFQFSSSEEGEDTCEAYEEYLEAFRADHREGTPYSHDDFHLLAAELESLVDLELEFGYLLPDQNQRKMDLADRLFIDPESLVDGAWDEEDDDFGTDNPAFWN